MPTLPRPAVFLDLNGTLVLPVQASSCEVYTPIDGCIEAVMLMNHAGFICPVVTVQSRIAKGIYSDKDFRIWFGSFKGMMRKERAQIFGPYVCPHQASDACACAKPQPLLYQLAAKELNIDLSGSFVVGDTAGDMQAAIALGVPGCLVRTGWGPKQAGSPEERLAAYTGRNLLDVARWIVSQPRQSG